MSNQDDKPRDEATQSAQEEKVLKSDATKLKRRRWRGARALKVGVDAARTSEAALIPKTSKPRRKRAMAVTGDVDEAEDAAAEGKAKAKKKKMKKKKVKKTVTKPKDEAKEQEEAEEEEEEPTAKRDAGKAKLEEEAEGKPDKKAPKRASPDTGRPEALATGSVAKERQPSGLASAFPDTDIASTTALATQSVEILPPVIISEEMLTCQKICAGNLPPWADKAQLWKDFEECGEVTDVYLLRNWYTGASAGVAFITYRERVSAELALDWDNTIYHGQVIRVNFAPDKPPADESGGNGKGKKGKYLAKGRWEQTQVFQKGGKCFGGKGGFPGMAAPMALADVPETCTGVLIRNLSFAVSEDELSAFFAQCGGGPTRTRILTDKRTGSSKGKAFVDFAARDGVIEALKLTGKDLKGRRMIIENSKPKDE